MNRAQRRERDRRHVFALLEIRRVRAGAGEDDRVALGEREGRVVPATAQVVAGVVVRSAAEPARDRVAVATVLEHDEGLFEVGLVIVGAEERRAPVVHAVHEHVVEHDPSVTTDDAPVVDDPLVLVADDLVALRGGGRRPAGHAAAHEERSGEPRVDQSREEADA